MDRSRTKPLAWPCLLSLCACTGSIEGYSTSSRGPGGILPPGAVFPGGPLPPGAVGIGPDGLPIGPDGQPIGPDGLPIAGGGALDPTMPGTLGNGGPAALRCETPDVGPSPLRRLTHAEYDNAVRDLIGASSQPAREFARDQEVGLFDNTASAQTVPQLLGDQYVDTAVRLAEEIPDVEALLGCDPAGGSGDACVRGYIERLGRRAFRRPLASAETDRLFELYADTRTLSDPETGVRAVVAGVLASPDFLFRLEQGGAASTFTGSKLATPFELAARLSSLIWSSLPDELLLDAAEAGLLATREQVAVQARRMLDDPKARTGMLRFYTQWLGLPLLESSTKDPEEYPTFDDELRSSMAEETRRFVEHVLFEDDASLSTLLTADYSFVNQPLAALYGVSGPGSASSYSQVTHDAAERAGIITQASMLATFASANESSPVKRGKFVRVRMLCHDLPDPPPNIPDLPAPQEGVSTRERFAMHTNDPACSGCHSLIDGLGFGLESYDGIGAFRTMDRGVPVDSSGEVTRTRDIDGTYAGGPELARKLATSAQARDCAPTQWMRYALGRREDDADTCSLVAVQEAFAASGGDLRELVVALTQTDAFFNYRQSQ